MNPHADVLHRGDNPWSKRPRTVVAGLLITLAVFAYLVRLSQHDDENVVWIGWASGPTGGVAETLGQSPFPRRRVVVATRAAARTGGAGRARSTARPRSGARAAAGLLSTRVETELAAKPAPYHDEVMYGDDYDWDDYDYGRRGEDYGDDEYSNYHHEWDDHPRHNRYDEYDDFVPARGRQAYYGDDFDLDDEFQGRAEDPDDPDLGEPEPERDPAHAWTEDELEATG
eukprot:CAMPEP_0185165790 /NCGR_PEP_ID=MMETSP1139-20130426/11448_1 /TAXON_ID=298111 /ORGANISM="Pavlova sp., Strain CCMP459" /LENGTH=227 /DNA_ID=CAMNT_0027731209 /DNA_START=138 /DNA_END=821 /DNA_ORIENTATION=-